MKKHFKFDVDVAERDQEHQASLNRLRGSKYFLVYTFDLDANKDEPTNEFLRMALPAGGDETMRAALLGPVYELLFQMASAALLERGEGKQERGEE